MPEPERVKRIIRDSQQTGRTAYQRSRPIVLKVFQDLKSAIVRLDQQLDSVLIGQAPRRNRQLVKTIVWVSVVVVALFFIQLTALILLFMVSILAVRALLQDRHDCDTSRLLQQDHHTHQDPGFWDSTDSAYDDYATFEDDDYDDDDYDGRDY